MKIGIDIGGTKCAVVLGDEKQIIKKIKFDTKDCKRTVEEIMSAVEAIGEGDAIGISCGGPLDSGRGVIMSPPNLPDWNDVHIVDMLTGRFGIPAYLCNDANACALAEWKYGAGRGTQNMVFLTFGTGLGAGLILNGRLYEGACGMAGEVGHVRLSEHGPVGYGKAGSFEGFCSGRGIAQIGRTVALECLQSGRSAAFCSSVGELDGITAKLIAEYADRGDVDAQRVYAISGEMLGRGLSMIVDILNPEVIVIGSVFSRSENLLRKSMEKALRKEALGASVSACRVVGASLGENIGDFAALSVAFEGGK